MPDNLSLTPPPAPGSQPNPAQQKMYHDLNQILAQSWELYKKIFIERSGRPLGDPDVNDIDGDGNRQERLTFSESASYVLLRAVWMNDRNQFDDTWKWTKDNLQKSNLNERYNWGSKKWEPVPGGQEGAGLAWRWTPSVPTPQEKKKGKEGKGGVIHQTAGGAGPWRGSFEGASDADLDVAAALIFAHQRWHDQKYLKAAQALLGYIWDNYVKYVDGKPYLVGGEQFRHNNEINPSYFRPFYFNQLFAAFDKNPSHNWKALASTSYRLLEEGGDAALGGFNGSVNLPPNWLSLDAGGGIKTSPTFLQQNGEAFFTDAFRVLFATAMEKAWVEDPTLTLSASRYLTDKQCTSADSGPYCFLRRELFQSHGLRGGYHHDGTPLGTPNNNDGFACFTKDEENKGPSVIHGMSPDRYTLYGNALPYFYFSGDLDAAQKIIDQLQQGYHRRGYWEHKRSYYSQNWVWLGLAMIARRPTDPVKPAAVDKMGGKVPREFDRYDEYADDLFARNRGAIDWFTELAEGKLGAATTHKIGSKKIKRKRDLMKAGKAAYNIFEGRHNRWLKEREMGCTSGDLLDITPLNIANNYQTAQLAFILASQPEKYSKYLAELGFGRIPSGSLKQKRFGLYQDILKKYQENAKKRYSLKSAPDPRLEGEILLQLAISSPDKKTARGYYAQALSKFEAVISNRISDDENIANAAGLKGKNYFALIEAQHPHNKFDEYRRAQGLARMLKAQIILLQSGDKTDPLDVIRDMVAAYNNLKKAAGYRDINGLFFLQLKQLAAECLTRYAFVLKDLDRTNRGPEKMVVGGKIGQSHLGILRQARALLLNIDEWRADYDSEILRRDPNKEAPQWLKLIHTWSRIWQAKARMFEAGEIRKEKRKGKLRKPKDYALTQFGMLREAEGGPEAGLRWALKVAEQEKGLIEEETVADLHRTLAENLARQAFISMDFGAREKGKLAGGIQSRGYEKLFEEAHKELDLVIGLDLEDFAPKSREAVRVLKADARVWRAKILLTQASKIHEREKRESVLSQALAAFAIGTQEVFGSRENGTPLLQGFSLSSALQTIGDIYAAQRDFEEAGAMYRLALGNTSPPEDKEAKLPEGYSAFVKMLEGYLKEDENLKGIFTRNFQARASLGDIYNWQGKYEVAISHYQQVPKDAQAYTVARLGMLEAEMRSKESYSDTEIGNLENAAKEIFSSYPPGSFLMSRALGDLMEAYRTDEDRQENIIYIGNRLLDRKELADVDDKKKLEGIIAGLIPIRARLEPRLKTELYLRMAEAHLWRQRFDESLNLLAHKDAPEPGTLPAYVTRMIELRPELKLLHRLIQAEALMRRDKSAKPFEEFLAENGHLHVAFEELDPYLASRIVLDEIEAYMVEDNFKKAVEVAKAKRDDQKLIGDIEELFDIREPAFQEFRFKLDYALINAYIGWEKFPKAREVAEASRDKALALMESKPHLMHQGRLEKARSLVYLGRLAYYDEDEQNFLVSRDRLLEALALVHGDTSKKPSLVRVEAEIELGEVFRFGPEISDMKNSEKHYRNALDELDPEKLPKKLNTRPMYLFQIYFGLAALAHKNGDIPRMWRYLEIAQKNYDKLLSKPKEFTEKLDKAKIDGKVPYLIFTHKRYVGMVRDGYGHVILRNQETSNELKLRIPLYFPDGITLIPTARALYHTASSSNRTGTTGVTAGYLGVELNYKVPEIIDLSLGAEVKPDVFGLRTSWETSRTTPFRLPWLYRRPDAQTSFVAWSQWATLIAAYHYNREEDRKLDTYYGYAAANSAFLNPPDWFRLRAGIEANDYYFLATGDYLKRFEIKGRADLESNLTDELKIRASLSLPLSQYERERDQVRKRTPFNEYSEELPYRGHIEASWSPAYIPGTIRLWWEGNSQVTGEHSYEAQEYGFSLDFAPLFWPTSDASEKD
jgi:endo-1,4-beta-D-glucanase Y